MAEREAPQNSNVRRDVDIVIKPYREGFELKPRLVTVWDEEKEREIVLLTNHPAFGATTIARTYKERWQIELFVCRDLYPWLNDPFQAPPVLQGVHDGQLAFGF